MELYTYFRSSAAYRVRIALNLKKITHTLIPVNLLTKEHQADSYKAINGQGLIPALKLSDDRVITQSTAILEYLENCYPDIPLIPNDPFQASQVRSFCNIIACDIHPINNLRILSYLTGDLKLPEAEKLTWYRRWIEDGFDVLETQLSSTKTCFDDKPGLADAYLIPQVYNAIRFNLDLDRYPKISNIYEYCNHLPAFINAAPEAQPDCP
jgi:maleylacetoacetate isomerase